MHLSQLTPPPVLPVSVAELSDHMRLGTGFADDGAEDPLLLTYIQSATAAIERALSMAFASRSYELTLTGWDREGGVRLPVGPASSVASVTVGQTVLDPTRYQLVRGRPDRLVPVLSHFPEPGAGERVRIVFHAGFGVVAEDVPADLRQAVTLLAGEFYENRNGGGFGENGFPPGVEALIWRYRPVRL